MSDASSVTENYFNSRCSIEPASRAAMGTGGGDEQDGSSDSRPQTPSMKKLLDLQQCVQDSPSFRSQLSEHEQDVGCLEVKLEKVVQSCDRMVTSGNAYMEDCRSFSNSVKELAAHFEKGESVSGSLKRFYEVLNELQSYYGILFDQAQRSVQTSLKAFLSGELRKVKDAKKAFYKVSDELNTAIHRNAHAPRSRAVEAEEASIVLSTVQSQFSHYAIEYAYQLNLVKVGKGHQILDNLLAFMRAQFTFFHQGYELLHEYDPFMRQVASEVDKLRKAADVVSHDMESRHTLVTPKHLPDGSPDVPLLPMDNPAIPIEMGGYLFKRASNKFKSWSRRWFTLRNNRIVYQSDSKAEEFAVAEDLRICTVKFADDLERRFCFEIVTPMRSCMLQADSDVLRKKWVAYLEAGIARALRISASNKKNEDIEEIRKRSATIVSKGTPADVSRDSPCPSGRRADTANSNYSLGLDFLDVLGNDKCADCGSRKPKWASINLGIMLCIECSGIHRSLGVHISKVRSVTLDDWDVELQKIMCCLGNARVNGIYEYDIPAHVKKPNPQSSRAVRETFIKAKYVQHAFVHPHPNFERPEIPVPPPTFPDLLTPSKSPLAASLGSTSPQAVHRRSFSPSLKLRSPRSLTGSLRLPYRPSSTTSSINQSDTEDDVSRSEFSATVDPSSSSLHLLAANLSKLQKSERTRNKGSYNLADKLGDKFKSARRSSKKITGYALSKLGGQGTILRRGKRSKSKEGRREVHSDTEEGDELSTSSTPLLHSMSASTQNLCSSPVPPPKPPRTFKTRFLGQSAACNEEEENIFNVNHEDDFSTDVLNALKQVSSVLDQDTGEGGNPLSSSNSADVIVNGLLTPSLKAEDVEVSLVKRSESSPLLSQSSLSLPEDIGAESSCSDLLQRSSHSIGLQPIAEGKTEPAAAAAEMTDGVGERKVNTVPLRRKTYSSPHTASLPQSYLVSHDISAASHDISVVSHDISAVSHDEVEEELKKDEPIGRLDKRLSVMSTTSADFFSAASSEANSTTTSPDFLRHDIIPNSTATLTNESSLLLVPSSGSGEEEYFSTPPSSPNPVDQPDAADADKIEEMVEPPDVSEEGVATVAMETEAPPTFVEEEEEQESVVVVVSGPPKKEKEAGRKRSLTVSDSMPCPLITRGGSPGPPQVAKMSKDDNFQTEYHHLFKSSLSSGTAGGGGEEEQDTGVLATSFSTQDLAEILGGGRGKGTSSLPNIEPVTEEPCSPKEGKEKEEGEVVREEGEKGEMEEEEVKKGDDEEEGKLESVSMADRSASPTCSSMGGSTSPEIVEPVVIPDDITPDTFLYSCVSLNDLPGVLCAIAHGASTNYINKKDKEKSPILLAAEGDNSEMVEYLYQNGAKLTAADQHGRTLLHYAVLSENANLVMTLLKRGAQPDLRDSEGKDPMALAMEKENGDIVTMLRMSMFKTQNSTDDRQSQYMEELASEFYRDIEVASMVDPDRMKRKSTTSSIEDSSSSISRDSK